MMSTVTQVAAGSKWYDLMPSHWRLARLDHVAVSWPSNVDKHSIPDEIPVRLCNYVDVYKNDEIVEHMDFMRATATSDQVERFRLQVGDTVVTKDSETADDIGIPAFVSYEASDLVCGYHLSIVRPQAGAVVPRFLFWVLRSRPVLEQWAVLASGVTRVGIRAGDLAKAALLLPPLVEQRAIADFLDRETMRIDTLIEEQQRLIDLLRERRVAIAEGAVTVLPWTTPLRSVAELIQTGPFGSQLKSAEYEPGGTPVINPSHIARGVISPDEGVAVGTEKAATLSRHAMRAGDLAVARRGELGRCAIVRETNAGALCGTGSALVRVNQQRVDPDFLALVFTSRRNRDSLSLSSVGSTMDNLNADIIGALRIPAPPLVDQMHIVATVTQATEVVDTLIVESERLIELARERRSALITAAVTGQIDARGEVA